MEIEGCVHVREHLQGENICADCKGRLRYEREVGLQIIPITPTPEKGHRMPPPPMPADIDRIIPDRGPTKPTVH